MLIGQDGERIATKLQAQRATGRRHDLVKIHLGGKLVAQYGIRRGSGELSHDYIPRQIHLSPRQTHDLSACTLSRDEYFEILRGKGLVD